MKHLKQIFFAFGLLLAVTGVSFATTCSVPVGDSGAQLVTDINLCLSTGVFDASSLTSGTLAAARMPALTGDCTTSLGTVATTCTKTSGASFAASATVDATNANNISAGTLAAARLPAFTGDTTSVVGASATTTNFVKNGKTPVDTTQGINALAAATGNYNMNGFSFLNLTGTVSRSLMMFADPSGPTAAGTYYFSVYDNHNTSEGAVNARIPVSATIKNLYCTDDGPPGIGDSDTFTVRVNSGSTALTCAITDGNTQCSDLFATTGHSGTISGGQPMTMQDVVVGTPSVRPMVCEFEVDITS